MDRSRIGAYSTEGSKMEYQFKVGPELAWLIIVTLAGVVAQAVATQGAAAPTDWRAWATALAIATVRAIVGAVLGLRQTGGATNG